MTGRTRRWLPIAVVALVALGVALLLGIGRAMDQNPCDHDCPLTIVNATLSVEAPDDASRAAGRALLDGVIVPPHDCASATIAIDVYGADASSQADREWIGHGSATTQNLDAGKDWPFEIVISGIDPRDHQAYSYDLSELSCRRAD
ncbi:MAG: hypothetical protein ABEK03_03395 [Candidatus Bipolaricaulia bacterium]